MDYIQQLRKEMKERTKKTNKTKLKIKAHTTEVKFACLIRLERLFTTPKMLCVHNNSNNPLNDADMRTAMA